MRVFYNEWDEPTAAWLRELGARHHLPAGHVDTRSIRDVRPDDVREFDQAHWFAGIGGWPLALKLAGHERLSCWTGSPPCQPFSIAGQQRGSDDERHLAPAWLDLIRECRPVWIFGEQVADAIRVGWLDDLFDALEGCGYACGAAVLPACSVGAPHIRKRLFFGAVRLAHDGGAGLAVGERFPRVSLAAYGAPARQDAAYGSNAAFGLADTVSAGRPEWRPQPRSRQAAGRGGRGGLDHGEWAGAHRGGWSGADWIGCRDGKFRPVEPGSQPLAHGIPARVGRLRGYGNAIVPQVAAAFIKEFIGAVEQALLFPQGN
ncbi:DNA cytosine methyltransferase [Tanticharoenia sakaeratensis]|uniref:DNA (cytosine-5-)-methyltransferase n=1 Tax=Tanticharoenia sakaeratensis NBRC 103193 TaxID=1231623 RepID=A0A0D6MP88_9PROT|nr:DNA cytosine methyltransferase [Tanticharoenia sakaeratensis]GAN55230.1 C-specific methylase [Tanticharoenia sakaeratensis NBRC 103193]GBQ23302.1 site-specific DNA methylase [Tanticharoenia sakaeratensis NBRC 103193]